MRAGLRGPRREETSRSSALDLARPITDGLWHRPAKNRWAPASVCENERVPSREQIDKALEAVIDPELRRSIVELQMVRAVEISRDHYRVCPLPT